MKPHFSRYLLEMVLGFVGYALGLCAYNGLLERFSRFKYFLLLLPVIPLLYVAAAILRYVTASDEMWRKVMMEGMAFAGLATAFTCFSLLFVRDLGGNVQVEWGFYIFWVYSGIGMAWSGWRYR